MEPSQYEKDRADIYGMLAALQTTAVMMLNSMPERAVIARSLENQTEVNVVDLLNQPVPEEMRSGYDRTMKTILMAARTPKRDWEEEYPRTTTGLDHGAIVAFLMSLLLLRKPR